MHDAVQLKQVPEQPMAVVRGNATMATLPAKIRELFDQFYASFKSKGELNIVFYPGDVAGEFEIACGVQLEQGGNASTPAGAVATTVYMGPYDQMKPAHHAIHQWVRENGRLDRRAIVGSLWTLERRSREASNGHLLLAQVTLTLPGWHRADSFAPPPAPDKVLPTPSRPTPAPARRPGVSRADEIEWSSQSSAC